MGGLNMRINIVRSVSLLLMATGLTSLVWAQHRPLSSEELQALASRQAARLEETQSYLETNRFRNGLSSDHTLKLASTPILDERGTLHARFDQLYKGIPIRNAQVLTHLAANGQMLEPTSYLYSRIEINTTPAISREQAVNAIWTALVSSRRSLAEMPVSAVEATVELQIHPELETVLKPGAEAAATGRNPNADDHFTRVRGIPTCIRSARFTCRRCSRSVRLSVGILSGRRSHRQNSAQACGIVL
jgi:Zn-dependent metalloprotease